MRTINVRAEYTSGRSSDKYSPPLTTRTAPAAKEAAARRWKSPSSNSSSPVTSMHSLRASEMPASRGPCLATATAASAAAAATGAGAAAGAGAADAAAAALGAASLMGDESSNRGATTLPFRLAKLVKLFSLLL